MTTPFVGTGTSLFVPTSIAGCSLWLDGADTSTLTRAGTSISQWRDKANSFVYNGSSTLTPVNSLTGVFFNGGNTMTGTTNLSLAQVCTNATDMTCLLVLNTSSSTAVNASPFHLSLEQPRFMPFYNGSGGLFFDAGNQANPRLGGSFTNNVLQIHVFTRVVNTLQIRVNGSVNSSNTFASPANFGNQAYVPYMSAAGARWTGTLCEAIYYGAAVGTAGIQQLEGYLAWKWGLQSSLPAGHPYKTTPVYSSTSTPFPTTVTPSIATVTVPKYFTSLSVFRPTQISGCSLWLDAVDSTSMSLSGTNITQWRDKSGNGNNATVSSTAYASYSNPGVYFNNSYYTTSYPANPSNETLFIVFNKPVLANNVTNTVIGSQTGGREIGIGTVTTSQFAVMNAGTAFGSITAVGSIVANTMTFGVSQITSGSTAVQLNGGSFASSVSLSFSSGKTTDLGRENGTSFGYVGFVYEILIYNVSLNTSQRQQVEGYLAWKWGLVSNLPANHPYKNPIAPFPYAIRTAAQAKWQPTQIAGCQLWLDAADPATLTLSGSNVTQWRDKSGNGRNAAGFVGTGIYSSTGFNSKPTIQITPSGTMASPIPAATFSNNLFLFIVYQKTGANNSLDTLVTRTSGNKPAPLDYYAYSTNTASRLSGNGTAFRSLDNTNTVTRNTSPTVLSIFINSSSINWIESVNGTATSYTINGYSEGGGGYGDTATSLYIGTRSDSASAMTGNISEIIAYNAALSNSQRQQIEGYLAWKWGLVSNLPAIHPYKTIPPAP